MYEVRFVPAEADRRLSGGLVEGHSGDSVSLKMEILSF